jgi:hypothetical protein
MAPIFAIVSSVLFTRFTAFDTPSSHWIGFQVIQGVGNGFGLQQSSLAVQLDLKDSPDVVPVGIALVMFLQYLGATIAQVIAGTIFNAELRHQLEQSAGLTRPQVALLVSGGITNVRKIVDKAFPQLMNAVLEAFNAAITKVFVSFHPPSPISCCAWLTGVGCGQFVPVGGAAVAFFMAWGIKWNKIESGEEKEEVGAVVEDHSTSGVERSKGDV